MGIIYYKFGVGGGGILYVSSNLSQYPDWRSVVLVSVSGVLVLYCILAIEA